MASTVPDDPRGRGLVRSLPELRALARERIGNRLLVSVSNREPFVHTHGPDGTIQVRAPVGGLTVALNSAMEAVGGVWVALASGDADREAADSTGRVAVPPDRPAYDLQRVWISEEEQRGYYSGFANQALWPLCHNAYEKPAFRSTDWAAYKTVNARFADQVANVVGDREALVFIQDYHFALLPAMVSERCPRATCVQFWHIPWPLPDILRFCPWREELLEGLLGNDLVGFHTPQYAERFLAACARLQGAVRAEADAIRLREGHTRVGTFPISIDFDGISAKAASAECDDAMARLRSRFGLDGKFVILGLDRIDYTKGVLERLGAVEVLLERHPEIRGKLAYLHAGAPSRLEIPAYRDLNEAMEQAVDRINARFGLDGTGPVISLKEHLLESEVLALYRLADVCVVSSLDDGMNLVAKEFLAARNDDGGHLLLSEFTGAAWELPGAECFNPFATEALADRLFELSRQGRGEAREQTRHLREHIRQHTVYGWIGSILEAAPPPRGG